MAAKIQRVGRQAYETFKTFSSHATFNDNFKELKSIINQITASDVGFDYQLVTNNRRREKDAVSEWSDGEHVGMASPAPVTYVHLYEDSVFSMGIFVLKDGVRLPLHDHPGMHGLIKVIHGSALFRCYSEQPGTGVPEELLARLRPWHLGLVKVARRMTPTVATQHSLACVLTPEEANLHEIQAHEGPMAFLDILSPPYDHDTGGRLCHYYRELSTLTTLSNGAGLPRTGSEDQGGHLGLTWQSGAESILVEVPQPPEFWCDPAEYQGPEIFPMDDSS